RDVIAQVNRNRPGWQHFARDPFDGVPFIPGDLRPHLKDHLALAAGERARAAHSTVSNVPNPVAQLLTHAAKMHAERQAFVFNLHTVDFAESKLQLKRYAS